MKRAIALAAALIMLALPLTALGESFGLLTAPFGDFTLTLDPNMPIDLDSGLFSPDYVKKDNEVMFILYPAANLNADRFSSINVVWTREEKVIETEEEILEIAEALVPGAVQIYEETGFTVKDSQLLSTFFEDVDGKRGAHTVYTLELDASALGGDADLTVYQKQITVSDPAFGTYYFTLTARDEETLSEILDPIIGTLVWTL